MKTIKERVLSKLQEEFFGHPSREEQADIEKLKDIVLLLSHEIDELKKLPPSEDKKEIKDIIDCILKFDTTGLSSNAVANYFEVIQRDLKKEIKPSIEGEKKETRFILDIRNGCGAVRDTKHPKYNKDYPGLHFDTSDVVEYRHGFKNTEKGIWEMKEEDIKFLQDYCNSLNNTNQ